MIAIAGGILIVLVILAVGYLGLMMIGLGDKGPGITLILAAIGAALWVIL